MDPRFEANSMLIYQPRFLDEKRQRVRALARLADGRVLEMDGDRHDQKSDFIRDVFAQYTEDEIVAFTERENRATSLKREVELQAAIDRRSLEENEITFQAKAKALDLPEVRNCTDKRIARKIRRSKSAFEVAGWLAVAFSQSLANEKVEQDLNEQETSQVV